MEDGCLLDVMSGWEEGMKFRYGRGGCCFEGEEQLVEAAAF